jgi:hypothetical protein
MRNLTVKQKNILRKFVEKCYVPWEKRFTDSYKFQTPEGKRTTVLWVEHVPDALYKELERINFSEILHSEIDRFLHDESVQKKYSYQ